MSQIEGVEVDDYTTTSSFHATANHGIHIKPLVNATTNFGIYTGGKFLILRARQHRNVCRDKYSSNGDWVSQPTFSRLLWPPTPAFL